jgi:hypothetical protein
LNAPKCTNKFHSEQQEARRLDSQNQLLVDESATMGANLALARRKKIDCRCRPTRRFSFNLAYDGMGFNGLLLLWGALKKQKHPITAKPLPAAHLRFFLSF